MHMSIYVEYLEIPKYERFQLISVATPSGE